MGSLTEIGRCMGTRGEVHTEVSEQQESQKDPFMHATYFAGCCRLLAAQSATREMEPQEWGVDVFVSP